MSTTTEQQAIDGIAEDYARRGYKVTVHPSAVSLPDFLERFQPDILAESPTETVVVEVKTNAQLPDHRLEELSREIAKHPGWRFEFVLANPRSGQEVPSDAAVAEPRLAEVRLHEAERLLKAGSLEAAVLLAWSAAESALRQLASREQLDATRGGSSYLLKQLVSNGLLTRERYERLAHAMELRNAVSHGFASPDPTLEQVRDLIAEGRILLRAVRS